MSVTKMFTAISKLLFEQHRILYNIETNGFVSYKPVFYYIEKIILFNLPVQNILKTVTITPS